MDECINMIRIPRKERLELSDIYSKENNSNPTNHGNTVAFQLETTTGTESANFARANRTAPVSAPRKRKFSGREKRTVQKVMANIVNFMEEDSVTFNLFYNYDYQKEGFIEVSDFE